MTYSLAMDETTGTLHVTCDSCVMEIDRAEAGEIAAALFIFAQVERHAELPHELRQRIALIHPIESVSA